MVTENILPSQNGNRTCERALDAQKTRVKERRTAGQKTMAAPEGAAEGEAPPQDLVLPTQLTPQGVPLSATPGDIEAHLRAAFEYMDATCPGWNGSDIKKTSEPASDTANAQMDDPAEASAVAQADAEGAHAEMTF